MVKVVPLYGEISSIPAKSQDVILEYKIPTGYVGELVGVGVIPDYDPDTGESNLDGIKIAVAETPNSGVGTVFPHSNFSANHNGKNALPYGDRASKQPMYKFDIPLVPDNLTYKIDEGKVIQIVGKAGDKATGKVRVRAELLLLDREDVERYYGIDFRNFASLPGGHKQEKPRLLYAEYFDNINDTEGTGKWEDLVSLDVMDYEEITIKEIGVAPHDNALLLRFYDDRNNRYFPDREPYYFRIKPEENMLPFGDDDDYQPRSEAPIDLKNYVWSHTTMKIQIKDNNAVVPAKGVRIQLIGEYRVI